jgi:predicted MFS family arabinose efflux permease
MIRLLSAIFVVIFASTMFIRSVDPLIPIIAADLGVLPGTAALLSTAFALPYALSQPPLGAAADIFGKIKLMLGCLVVLLVTAFVGAFAPNFEVLMISRIVGGVAAGGLFPIAVALVGDLVPLSQRQVAVGRLLAAGMMGNLFGSAASGVIGDLVGWRMVFLSLGGLGIVATVAAVIGLRGTKEPPSGANSFASIVPNYRLILSHPLAKYCFGGVLIEGICLFGVFPYVALLMHETGETRATIAGLVLAGFGVGGVCYALAVSWLVRFVGERRSMAIGGIVMACALLTIGSGFSWPIAFGAFMAFGFAFYMLHGVIQIYVTELAPAARGSAMALHSFFFFVGQGIGAPVYGIGFAHIGQLPTFAVAAACLLVTGLTCSRKLRRASASRAGA